MIAQDQIKVIASGRPTPFYLYSEEEISCGLQYVNSCFSWQTDFLNYFPMKDNPNPVILKYLWNSGSGILTCGRAELLLAIRCGFSGTRLMYQPVCKDLDAEQLASELKVSWLITSPEYLPHCQADTVLLRVYPDHGPVGNSDLLRIRSGFPMKQLVDALQILKIRRIPHIGLELQMKAFDLRPQAYVNKAAILLSMLDELKQRTGVSICICNLGDDPGPISNPDLGILTLDEASNRIKELVEGMGEKRPAIHTGLGRQILGRSAMLVSRVIEIRQLRQPYLVLDASYGQFVRPALLSAEHDISIIRTKRSAAETQVYRIIGRTPDDLDKLSPGKHVLQASPGDLCIIHDVGCSGHSMPMLHRFQGICPEYLLRCSGEVEQIGRGKTEEEIMEFLTSF